MSSSGLSTILLNSLNQQNAQDLPEDWPWNSPLSQRMHAMYEYKGPGNLKDFVFLVGPQPEDWVFVHKSIVDAGSPVLHRIIKGCESAQSETTNCPLYEMDNYQNLDSKQFHRMIEFIYTDDIKDLGKISKDELTALSAMAKLFEMTRLEELCIVSISELTPQAIASSTSTPSDWVVLEHPIPSSSSSSSSMSPPPKYNPCHESKLTLTPVPQQLERTHVFPSMGEITTGLHEQEALTPQSDEKVQMNSSPFSASNIASSIKGEILADVKSELKAHLIESLKKKFVEDMQNTIKDEITSGLFDQLRDEVKNALATEMKDDLTESVREEVEQDVIDRIVEDVRDELTKTMSGDVKQELVSEFQDTIREALESEIMNEENGGFLCTLKTELNENMKRQVKEDMEEITTELKDTLLSDIKSTLHDELKDEMVSQLRSNLEDQMEEEILDDEDFKEDLKTEIKNALDKVVVEELTYQVKDNLKVEIEEGIMSNQEFKDSLTTELQTTLRQVIKEELVSKLKDELMTELKDELRDELAQAIMHDMF